MKQTTAQQITELKKKIEELEKQVNQENFEWVEINNENCPTLAKYGAKPFRIMKKKMRNTDGEVWNNINFYGAKAEAEKLGYRLPDIREMLALLEHYKNTKKTVSISDKEFLGIEELSRNEGTYLEWIEGVGFGFLRGGGWNNYGSTGAFALNLALTPGNQSYFVGFRCASDLP